MEDSLRKIAEELVFPDKCDGNLRCLDQGSTSLRRGPIDESGELEGFLLCTHCDAEAANCRKSLTANRYRFCFCAARQLLADKLPTDFDPPAESRV